MLDDLTHDNGIRNKRSDEVKNTMRKRIFFAATTLLAIIAVLAYSYKQDIERAAVTATLFTGAEQYENFNRMTELFPSTRMSASATPHNFAENHDAVLPDVFQFEGNTIVIENFLTDTDTSALLVVRSGTLVFERYMLTGGRSVNWLSMSVAKSFISAGIGIAVADGLIDIQNTMTHYLPSLAGSAYDGVKVKDVLQMSSGAAWNEDYSDADSDINRLGRLMALGGSVTEFVSSLQRETEPGTSNRYNSADTQALGLLLSSATGQTVTDYLQERLWHPLGMESDGYWITDSHDTEMVFFGLNATARDYAKLGELYRLKGLWGGKRILSEAWIEASTVADAPHLLPGIHEDFPLGYGYQWWIPESSEGEYAAIGVYNQFIYVNPSRNLVIVKLSAYSDYAISLDQSAYREIETIEFFREIGRSITTY